MEGGRPLKFPLLAMAFEAVVAVVCWGILWLAWRSGLFMGMPAERILHWFVPVAWLYYSVWRRLLGRTSGGTASSEVGLPERFETFRPGDIDRRAGTGGPGDFAPDDGLGDLGDGD